MTIHRLADRLAESSNKSLKAQQFALVARKYLTSNINLTGPDCFKFSNLDISRSAQHMHSVGSTSEFQELLKLCANNGNLLLVDFYATWCGPCRHIAPHFESLSEEYSQGNVIFARVNCDVCRDLCTQEFVSSLPTFKLYRRGECIRTIVGANITKLKLLLEEFAIDQSVLLLRNYSNQSLRNKAVSILQRIVNDVIREPSNEKFRNLNLALSDFSDCLLVVPGCMDFLQAVGFQDDTNSLFLPKDTDLTAAKKLIEQLKYHCPIQTIRIVREETEKPPASEPEFFRKLLSNRSRIGIYLDPGLQSQARDLCPTIELTQRAATKAHCEPNEVKPLEFLQELLLWFKQDFFRWADNFECGQCKSKMIMRSIDPPRPDETQGDAGNVEVYACSSTNSNHPTYRFPRYNNPQTLLRTRLGRCGEWANCFTLFLASVRHPFTDSPWFQACRYVLDWTDHVWCEVFITDNQTSPNGRWVHCDPCESQLDKPLLYESGWGKKLTYVMAYTLPPNSSAALNDDRTQLVDVQDVTWRYTSKFDEVCARRHLVRESALASVLERIHLETSQLWESTQVPSQHTKTQHGPYSLVTIARELASFLTPPKSTPNLPGRQTGSVEWRRARGELGAESESHASNVIKPSQFELDKGTFYLRYNSASDIYERPFDSPGTYQSPESKDSIPGPNSSSPNKQYVGWQSLAQDWSNIARKVEYDHHMVYLAREENSPADLEGTITWVLDLKDTDYEIGKISLFTNMVCYSPESRAHLTLCSADSGPDSGSETLGGSCLQLTPGSTSLFNSTDFVGASRLKLVGRLWSVCSAKPASPVAWQQAQLFRQKDTDYNTWSLEWKVELIKKKQCSIPDA